MWYYRLERNVGANGNFERVKQLATGEFFMWTGCDDIRPPDAIRLLVDALIKNPQAVMAHGPIIAKKPGEFEEHISNVMDLSSADSGQRIRVLTRSMRHIAMQYGLSRLTKLRDAAFEYPSFNGPFGRYGDDYLICLQMCFLGPIEYVPHPMIVYRMRTVPPDSPMGEDIPLTGNHLLHGTRRMWKSWSVMSFGCYYLLRFRQIPISKRLGGILAHVFAFVGRYKRRLAQDFLVISSSTMAAIPLTILRLVRRVPLFAHVDSYLKSFLQRS